MHVSAIDTPNYRLTHPVPSGASLQSSHSSLPRDDLSRGGSPMRLLSSAIQEGEPIPPRFTCEGANISPEFYWVDAPKETKSFVLILHDPDAPRDNGFTHWLLYDIPPNVTHIPEDLPRQAPVADSGLQGKNDSGKLGYTGPCPPSGRHRYFARLYALRKQLDLPPGATAMEVKMALEGKVIEQTELMGTFAKSNGQ
jgi:Raf kinase inhibitor-like YbhB/YbcL family protein